MKITKQEFDELYTDTISKKRYDEIIRKITGRFSEIVTTLLPHVNKGGDWFDYGNCSYQDEDSNGDFDPEEYKEYIKFGGQCSQLSEPFGYEFPTRWLWEDFVEEYKECVQRFRKVKEEAAQLAKARIETAKQKKDAIIKQALLKLTGEERQALGYK